MNMKALHRSSFLLALLLTGDLAAGSFSAPMVDLQNRVTGSAASMAIWSNASVSLAAGTSITLQFPTGYDLSALNPAACGCLFTKFSQSDGSFAQHEVTVTAGSVSGQILTISLPVAFYPGDFYLRLDPASGVNNPATPGMMTLVMGDDSGFALQSKGYWLQTNTLAATAPESLLSGRVTDLSGRPVAGALVVASSCPLTSTAGLNLGPAVGPMAMAPGVEWLSTITDANGGYSIALPQGGVAVTYYIQANYSKRVGVQLKTYQTPQQTVTVPGSATQVALGNPWILSSQPW
jgi:hypothetical protein